MSSTDIATRILHTLDGAAGPLASSDFNDVATLTLKAALDSLQSREMITYATKDDEVPVLLPEGEQIVEKGSHEARVLEAVLSKGMEGLEIKDLEGIVGKESAKVGQGKAFKEKWVKKEGQKLVALVGIPWRCRTGIFCADVGLGRVDTRRDEECAKGYPRGQGCRQEGRTGSAQAETSQI